MWTRIFKVFCSFQSRATAIGWVYFDCCEGEVCTAQTFSFFFSKASIFFLSLSLSLSCNYMCYFPSPIWNKRKKWTRLNTWIFYYELPVINPNKEWFVTVNIQLIFQVCLFFYIGLVFVQEVMDPHSKKLLTNPTVARQCYVML